MSAHPPTPSIHASIQSPIHPPPMHIRIEAVSTLPSCRRRRSLKSARTACGHDSTGQGRNLWTLPTNLDPKPTDRPANHPTNRLTDQPADQLQPSNGSIEQPTDQPLEPTNQLPDSKTKRPTNRSTNQPTIQLFKQPTDRPTALPTATLARIRDRESTVHA